MDQKSHSKHAKVMSDNILILGTLGKFSYYEFLMIWDLTLPVPGRNARAHSAVAENCIYCYLRHCLTPVRQRHVMSDKLDKELSFLTPTCQVSYHHVKSDTDMSCQTPNFVHYLPCFFECEEWIKLKMLSLTPTWHVWHRRDVFDTDINIYRVQW